MWWPPQLQLEGDGSNEEIELLPTLQGICKQATGLEASSP